MHRLPALGLLLSLVVCGCSRETAAPAPAAGDVLAEAAAFLDTDRPWSAARLLRRYQAEGGVLDAHARLLAARAEGGSGDWSRVRALLDGLEGLDTLGQGRGRYLLARALDEDADASRLPEARAGYDAFLNTSDPALSVERDAARLRRALVQVRLDAVPSGLAAVPGVSADGLAVLEAEALARMGRVARVDAVAERVQGEASARRVLAARIEARRRAGDLDAARRLAESARQSGPDAARAAFTLTAGRLAAQAGDAAGARTRYRETIETAPASPAAREAAGTLRQSDPTAAEWLALAQTDRALGLNSDAADAFRRWLDADVGTPAERADVRYQAADALFDAQRYDEVEALLAPIQARTDARELRAGALGRMGRTDEAAAVYLSLAASEPAPNLYFAADVLHQGGDLGAALPLYRQVEDRFPSTHWAGLARLRRAGQAFLDGEFADAARLWDGHSGERDALRARYWSARALAEAGDAEAAAERFRGVLRAERDSYYALLASRALGEPFWPVPLDLSPPADPEAEARVAEALRGVDALREAGFPEVAGAEVDRVVAGARPSYALAEALVARGYGRRAIRLGQSLSGGQNARRMRILYPFPFRRMIAAEARANGVDPFVAAALIRQESQFEARATSYVGARGLMQLMPATGRTLAAEVGIEDWDPEMLYLPEVNVHLGTRYVGQQVEAYDGSLPAVFGAYNAGPHQVEAWRAFPEFGRDALFTERIPFRETRDYVKILTRNRAIYEGLYGESDGAAY